MGSFFGKESTVFKPGPKNSNFIDHQDAWAGNLPILPN